MNDGETSHTTICACKNGEYDACDHKGPKKIHTSERVVVARADYRPSARVPVCRSDRFVVSAFRTQRCSAPFWIVELLDVLQVELKNAIALDLHSRVRMETRMETRSDD